jgi:hypothetical protein
MKEGLFNLESSLLHNSSFIIPNCLKIALAFWVPAIAIKLYRAALALARSAAILLTIRDRTATGLTLTGILIFLVGHSIFLHMNSGCLENFQHNADGLHYILTGLL